jgi:hypothetical protein
MKSIFQAIDVKMQGLIQVPLASNAIDQQHLSSFQALLALVCLIRHLCHGGQGTTATILKQEKTIKAYYALYKDAIKDPLTFRKIVLTEWAESSSKGYAYILCIMDIFSRKAWCYPMKTKNLSDTTPVIKKFFSESGLHEFNKRALVIIMSGSDSAFKGSGRDYAKNF